MASLTLIELQLKNIKSYQDETIKFIKKNNVIIGQNGSGKSTILESLVFGFYNEKSQSVKTNSDLLRNGEKKGSITVVFEINGKNYEIETILTDSGTTTKKLKYLDTNRVVEGLNSVLADLEVITEGIDKDVFKNVIYAEQGQIAELANMLPSKREELINKLMGLEKYEKTSRHIFQVLKQLNERIELKKEQIKEWKIDIKEIPHKELVGELETINDYIEAHRKTKESLDELEKELLELNRLHENAIKLTTELETGFNRKQELERESSNQKSSIMALLAQVQFEREVINTLNNPTLDILEKTEEQIKAKYITIDQTIAALEERKRKIHSLEIEKSEKKNNIETTSIIPAVRI